LQLTCPNLDEINIKESDMEALSLCMKNVKNLIIGDKFSKNLSLKGFEMLPRIITAVDQPVSFF